MKCMTCEINTEVKDSRPLEDGAVIRRRRACPTCGKRFTSHERRVDEDGLTDEFPVFTLAEQIACVEREIAMRRRVYPRWVGAKRMTAAKAAAEIATMESVLSTLKSMEDMGALL